MQKSLARRETKRSTEREGCRGTGCENSSISLIFFFFFTGENVDEREQKCLSSEGGVEGRKSAEEQIYMCRVAK